MRDIFAERLLEIATNDARVVFVTGDLGFGVFEEFAIRFPKQYLNVGVAEQNMIAVSTGLALEGRIVFAYSIGNFPVLRCLEQIRNDAIYHDANVKVVSIGGGFSYGPLGMSHHATEDIAVLRAMPGITGFTPGTKADVVSAVDELYGRTGTGYLRLDKSHGEESPGANSFVFGRWRVMNDGSDVCLVAAGGVLAEAQAAAGLLEARGLSVKVVNALQFAPVESGSIREILGDCSVVFTVEEHVSRGGLFGMVAEAVAEHGLPIKVYSRGIHGPFVSEVGSQRYLRQRLGLDANSLVAGALLAVGN